MRAGGCPANAQVKSYSIQDPSFDAVCTNTFNGPDGLPAPNLGLAGPSPNHSCRELSLIWNTRLKSQDANPGTQNLQRVEFHSEVIVFYSLLIFLCSKQRVMHCSNVKALQHFLKPAVPHATALKTA